MIDARHPLCNPEAGDHPLPSDPAEVAAALRAGQRCLAAYPYFELRYGARGEAFTRSDSGYLVTLTQASQGYVDQQVEWLAGVLASRGMPRWLMEVHLAFLHEELVAILPERAEQWRMLLVTARRLREVREARIGAADFERLAVEFIQSSGSGLDEAGALLVAAVCDEANGLDTAVPSLIRWLGDSARFGARWCVAVTHTLAVARALVRNGSPALS